MQSYGNSELPLNMEKAKEVAGKEYENMMLAFEEEDLLDSEIHECIEYGDGCDNKITKVVDAFIEKVNFELGISVHTVYIGSEAEGTNKSGELMWCIDPELPKRVMDNSMPWESWSTFS